jgi:tripeptide aminopeptidase
VRRATDGECERLGETFETLCRIESPSGQERVCANWVTAELGRIGLEVQEDEVGPVTGSDAGNLLARIPGHEARRSGDERTAHNGGGDSTREAGPSILLCAHLDTVPLAAPVEPVLVNSGWENANEGILGADNKAAVAVMLELARRLVSGAEPPPVGVELLFTVCEEVSLRGSREFDTGRLHSAFGYVFDHATPIGQIVLASPTHYRVVAELHGRPAHAGIEPEAGRSAIAAAASAIASMRLGRLDPHTTANVGIVAGGSAINVVPERCRLEAETRSLDAARAEDVATEMVDHLQDAANAHECDLDVTMERMFDGYRTPARAAQVQLAERALRACGYEPTHIVTGGASDANSFQRAGFPCTNLANGTERAHQSDERVSVQALEGMFEVALALIDEAGRAGEGEGER